MADSEKTIFTDQKLLASGVAAADVAITAVGALLGEVAKLSDEPEEVIKSVIRTIRADLGVHHGDHPDGRAYDEGIAHAIDRLQSFAEYHQT